MPAAGAIVGASNIVMMFCETTHAIASAQQRNTHDSVAGTVIRKT
jgi:hypothetical protein